MNQTPVWFLVLQAISDFAIVGTFFVYWRQLVAMRGQQSATREAIQTQSTIEIIQFLQQPSQRQARKSLRSLAGTPYESWTEKDRQAAEEVCVAYDMAGILIRRGIIPEEIIVENWGESIKRCHEAAKDLLREARKQWGEQFWDDFSWLASRVREVEEN
ncbi:MAG: hypothetical protein JWM11_7734 [Planctomycetaceae bacterium]|nr:hypothetical protein [Planctomycetaceae bacterium]